MEKIKHKEALGYSDIALGNHVDKSLRDFVGEILPRTLNEQRQRFDEYRDLLQAFSSGDMHYAEFAARVRRRENGKSEDFDEIPPEELPF